MLSAKDRRSFSTALNASAPADLQGCHLVANILGSSPDKSKGVVSGYSLRTCWSLVYNKRPYVSSSVGFQPDSLRNILRKSCIDDTRQITY